MQSVASGGQTTVISSVHTLHTASTAGVYVLTLDLSALALGDVLRVTVRTKVGAGGTTRDVLVSQFANVQSAPIMQTVPVASPHECVFVLKQTAGSPRPVPWEVSSL